VVLGGRVGGLVVVGDHWLEVAGTFVVGDNVQLAAAEVGEENRILLAGRDCPDPVDIELFLEDDLEGDARSLQGGGGDGRAREAVCVDVRGHQYLLGPAEPLGANTGPLVEVGDRSHRTGLRSRSDLNVQGQREVGELRGGSGRRRQRDNIGVVVAVLAQPVDILVGHLVGRLDALAGELDGDALLVG